MALYSYEAFSKEGKKIRGTIDAPSIGSVKEQLTRQGLFPIKVESARPEARLGLFARLFQRSVSVKDKILFSKQLAILLKSGVPLLQAIELLAEQFEGRMHIILVNIKDEIKEGISLADSLAKYPKIFEPLYVQLVRAGEATGKLEMILVRLTTYLERREEVSKRVRNALQYPIIQLIVAVLVVGVMLTVVVPQMAQNFASQKRALPGPTLFILGISNFITGNFFLLVITLIIFVGSFRYWKSTTAGARRIDQFKLRLPLIKYLSKTNAVVQFSYTLGMLMESGVHLSEALDIVVSIIDNQILADALSKARDNIIKEGKIAQYLQQTNMFPPIAIYLMRTGEQTGELHTMLLTIADNYEKDYIELIDRLTGLISPIMLVVMGIVVGFIVIAIALPIVQGIDIAGI